MKFCPPKQHRRGWKDHARRQQTQPDRVARSSDLLSQVRGLLERGKPAPDIARILRISDSQAEAAIRRASEESHVA